MKTTPRNYAKALAALIKDKPATREIVANFINVLRKAHQEKLINRIIQICEQILMKEKGEIKVEVLSAVELDEEKIDELKNMIEKTEDLKPFIEQKIDKSLKGGIKLKVKDYMIDASLQGKIEALKRALIDAA